MLKRLISKFCLLTSLLALLAAAPSPALAAGGDLIPAFDGDGIVTTNPTAFADSIWDIAIDASYGLYAVGYDRTPGSQEWRIENRSLNTGALNTFFGVNGVVRNNPDGDGTTAEEAYAVALNPSTNEMYIAGYDSPSGTGGEWRIEKRNLSNGSLIGLFGGTGAVTSNPSGSFDAAKDIAVDAGGIYVAGYDKNPGNARWRIEKRDPSTGALDVTFGSGGVVTSNPSAFTDDNANAIAIDASVMYVAGFDSNTVTSNYQWRIEKRNLTDGNFTGGFGSGGVVTSDPSTSTDSAYAIAIDSTNMYVVGSDSTPGYSRWRIEKRSLGTGGLVAAFDSDGVVTNDPCPAAAAATSVAVDATSIYVTGYDSCGSGYRWRIEKRDKTNGALDSSFGVNGVAVSDPTASSDIPRSIAVDSGAIYIAGEDGTGSLQWRIEKRELGGGGPPPPTVNLSAFPTTIETGQSSTLTWSSTDADSCAAVSPAGWTSSTATSGAEAVWPVATTTYIIQCTGPGGSTQQSTTVTVDTTCGEGSLNWTQTYNSGGVQTDYGNDVAVDSSGSIYITGYQATNGNDMFLRKYDSTGAFQWMQTYNSNVTQADYGFDVAVDSGGNIYVTGREATNGNDMFLRKYDSAGSFQWMQTYNSAGVQDDQGWGVAVDLGGNVYVTGYQATGGNDMFLRKYDSTGAFQWMQTYNSGGTQTDYGSSVAVDSGSNIYVTGYQATNGLDMFLRKYDSAGNFQWMQTYNSGGVQSDSAWGVAIDSANNIYVAGLQATNGTDMFLRKYDSSGNFQWMQTYTSAGSDIDRGEAVAVDYASNIYVIGSEAETTYDIFLRKYDSAGSFQWMQVYDSGGGAPTDYGYGVAVDSNNNLDVVGYQSTNGGDAVLLQYDGSGCGFSPPPTVNLSANPSTINSGEYSDLTWSSTDAVSCAAVSPAGWTSQTGPSGTERLYPTATTTYIIECTGAGGTSQQSTTVTVNGGGGGSDCGLRMFDGTTTITLDCETPATTTSLRIYNNGATSGIKLVDPADPNASRLRVQTPAGIKALRRQ